MTRNKMKDVVERLHRVWNTGELSAIPEIYAPDFVGHFPKASPFGELRGHSGIRGAIETVRRAFPDWTETIEDIVIEGDKVVTATREPGCTKEHFLIWLRPESLSVRKRYRSFACRRAWSQSNGA